MHSNSHLKLLAYKKENGRGESQKKILPLFVQKNGIAVPPYPWEDLEGSLELDPSFAARPAALARASHA